MNIDDERKFVKDKKNCPNCGAPIESEKCPYCGTYFVDFACIEKDKPFWLKIKSPDGVVHLVSVYLERMEVCQTDDYVTLYADNNPYRFPVFPSYRTHISMEFEAVPTEWGDKDGVYHIVIKDNN